MKARRAPRGASSTCRSRSGPPGGERNERLSRVGEARRVRVLVGIVHFIRNLGGSFSPVLILQHYYSSTRFAHFFRSNFLDRSKMSNACAGPGRSSPSEPPPEVPLGVPQGTPRYPEGASGGASRKPVKQHICRFCWLTRPLDFTPNFCQI